MRKPELAVLRNFVATMESSDRGFKNAVLEGLDIFEEHSEENAASEKVPAFEKENKEGKEEKDLGSIIDNLMNALADLKEALEPESVAAGKQLEESENEEEEDPEFGKKEHSKFLGKPKSV